MPTLAETRAAERPEPDVAGAIDRFAATANRIADERNAYLATARTLLSALKYARNHVLNPANTDTDDLLKVIHAAWDEAEAAGIRVPPVKAEGR